MYIMEYILLLINTNKMPHIGPLREDADMNSGQDSISGGTREDGGLLVEKSRPV